MSEATKHPCHSKQLAKLNRASGQIDGVKRMINEGRYCVDIMTQIKAARSALKAAELEILQTHMGHCLSEAIKDSGQDGDAKIDEIITLLKKYE